MRLLEVEVFYTHTDVVGLPTSDAGNAIYLSDRKGSYIFLNKFSVNLIPNIDI